MGGSQVTTLGELHYHSYRIVRTTWPLPWSETWTVLSSTWTKAESEDISDADEAAYEEQENTSAEWVVTDECDCEQIPGVWEG